MATTVEDQNSSSQPTIMQVTDVADLRLETIMEKTDEARLLHHAETTDIRRDLLDKLLHNDNVNLRFCRKIGMTQEITLT